MAMKKFHHFLYASHFILKTDQKPLEPTLSKSLNQATPRLQRILIRTFPYNFTIHYIPGVTNQLADACHGWETKKILLISPNYKYTRSHNNYQKAVTDYINSDYQCKLMVNLPCSNTLLCKAGPSHLNKYPQSHNFSGHLERN